MSIKVGIIGIAGVGKTQFIDKLEGKKCYSYLPTFDTVIRMFRYSENKNIEFRDFSGIQYYKTDDEYFNNLDVLLLMVDNRHISYINGKKMANELLKKYSFRKVMIVQNKTDGIDKDKIIPKAHKISVNNNTGITELMKKIISCDP